MMTTKLFKTNKSAENLFMKNITDILDKQPDVVKKEPFKKGEVVVMKPFWADGRKCIICMSEENLHLCSKCRSVNYCCKEHQKQDWPYHKTICKAV